MLGHEEDSELGGRLPGADARERLGGKPRADRHVVPLAHLADVVQQRAQQERVPVGDERRGRPLEGIVGVGVAAEDRPHACEGAREVCVDREPVVGVPLWTAADVGPRRKVSGQAIEPVERLERLDPSLAGPQHAQEGLEDRRGPDHRVLDVGRLDRVEERRRRHAAGFGRRWPAPAARRARPGSAPPAPRVPVRAAGR